MPNIIKTSISVAYSEEDIQKTTRFMDEAVSHEPVSYNHGEATLNGGTIDHELLTGVNMFVLHSDTPFSLKLGDTTAPEHSNVKMFAYDASSTTIFVSNIGTDPVKITFVSAKL